MREKAKQVLSEILLAGTVQVSIEIIAESYGFEHITFHMVNNIKFNLDNPFVRTTYPASWVSYYLLNNYVVIDPILRRAVTDKAPFCWSEINPNADEQRLFIKAMEFGLGQEGFSIPCWDALGRKSVLSLNSSLDHTDWMEFLDLHREDLIGISQDLHVQAMGEALSGLEYVPQLSPREFECLGWTAEGKTYSEIAIILDLSEHTVRSYLKGARLKLNSASLAQAVAKASRMSML